VKVKRTVGAVALAGSLVATCAVAETLSFIGTTDKNPLEYKLNEAMTFTVTLVDTDNGNAEVTGRDLRWTLTDDGGQTKSGTATSDQPLVVTHSMTNAGFARLKVEVKKGDAWLSGGTEFFDGGAGADIWNIREWPKPVDFDSFWNNAVKSLLATEATPTLTPYTPANGSVDVDYWVYSIPTIGSDAFSAATGVIAMPKNSKAGDNLGIIVHTFGYGYKGKIETPSTKEVFAGSGNNIVVHMTRWGENPVGDDAYYADFEANNPSLGFRNLSGKIQDTDQYKMHIRNLRALQYAKSRVEWNGRDIQLKGGSLGGYQALCLAGLDPDVTDCTVNVPWSVDLGGVKYGRMEGWRPGWTTNVDYIDAKNFAYRITCPVTFNAGLGDYICPPSGEVQLYRILRGKKKATFTQNMGHGSLHGSSATCANYVLQESTEPEPEPVVRRTMEFIGGKGSWKVATNWRDAVGKTNDLPRSTDIISLPGEANGAKNDWQGFEAYQLNLSAFNQGYDVTGLPVILDASGGGIYDTGYIYCSFPMALRGTNVPFKCTTFFGVSGRFCSADGQPFGIVKQGNAIGGLIPTVSTTSVPNPYAGLKYIDIAEGQFAFNANAKASDAQLRLFPNDMVITFSGLNTTLAFNGNFALTNLYLRETGSAIGRTHTISPQDSTCSGTLTMCGTMPKDETVYTGRMTGTFGFTWSPDSAAQSFVFSGNSSTVNMTGRLGVKNGTVAFREGASFSGLSEVYLAGANTALSVAGTPASGCTAKYLRLSTGSERLKLGAGVTLTVDTARVGDAGIAVGTYTGSAGTAGTKVAWIEGAGTLVVRETYVRRVYWCAKTGSSSYSGAGDPDVLANWKEKDGSDYIAATSLPHNGDIIVFNNTLHSKQMATTATFLSNTANGLKGVVFEGSGYGVGDNWTVIWGSNELYLAADGFISNCVAHASLSARIWKNIHVKGTGPGLRLASVSGGRLLLHRRIHSSLPVRTEGAGTVQIVDYSHSTNPTHEVNESYYGNYGLTVAGVDLAATTTEIMTWYKITNSYVRFATSDATLRLVKNKDGDGIWFGNGATFGQANGVMGTVTTTGGEAWLRFYDTPGAAEQTFTGRLRGQSCFLWSPSNISSFVFSGATSDTTGSLIVSNGTVRLEDGAKFTSLAKVVIAPSAQLSIGKGAQVASQAIDIGVDDNNVTGKVVIAKGSRIELKSVTINGEAVAGGIYDKTSGWISGDGRALVGDATWPEDKTAIWNRDDSPHRIEGTVWYKGVSLYGETMTETDLCAAPGAKMMLGASGVDMSSAGTYYLGWPIVFSGDQAWTIANGGRLDFCKPLDSYERGTITVGDTTDGKQVIFWAASGCVHDWWFGKNTTVVLRNAEGCGWGRISIDRGQLRPCGGEIPNTVAFTNNANETYAYLNAMDNTTRSTFLSPVSLPYSGHARLYAIHAPLRFKSTLSKPRGYIYFDGQFEFDAPVNFGNGAMLFDNATLYMNAATNKVGVNNFQFSTNGKLFTTVPYALSNSEIVKANMNVGSSGCAVWNLCGCDQGVTYLKGGPCSVVTSETAAVVHVKSTSNYASANSQYTWNNTAYDAGVPTNYVCFAGGAGLSIDGDAKGYVRIAGLSSTTGTLSVTGGGLVEMAASQYYPPDKNTYKGMWPNASGVSVTKGTLDVQHNKAFGKGTALSVSGDAAKVKLSYKGQMSLASLTLDGEAQEPGTYGSLTSSAMYKSACFEGTGTLRIGKFGLRLSVR